VKPAILVLCTGNSARSQMAEGLLRRAFGTRFDVFSAGTRPSLVRPEAIAVMAEIGVDISAHHSKHLDEFLGREFRYVLTVCDNARDTCPVFPGTAERIHWSLEDPAAVEGTQDQREAAFRRIRDEILGRIEGLTLAG
jgi:arsenate reductase (thioredoxin)